MEKEIMKILFLASNLPNMPKEDFVHEYNKLQERLQFDSTRFITIQKFALTIDMLQDSILTEKPNIIHFSGHGTSNGKFKKKEGYRTLHFPEKSGIIVQDEEGNPKIINTKAMANLFKLFSEDKDMNIDVVILNACYTEELAIELSKYVPYVIGVKSEIQHKAAIEFTFGFYLGVSKNKNYDLCYKLGQSRIELGSTNQEDIVVIHKQNKC